MDACAFLVFVGIGVLTRGASATAFARDLLCFESAWLVTFRFRFVVRRLLAVTLLRLRRAPG